MTTGVPAMVSLSKHAYCIAYQQLAAAAEVYAASTSHKYASQSNAISRKGQHVQKTACYYASDINDHWCSSNGVAL